MNSKQYLKQLKWLNNIIESKKEQLQKLRYMSSAVAGINYTADKVQVSGTHDGIGNAVAKIIDTENKLNEEILQYTKLYAEINAKIRMMPELDLMTVLIDKYLNFMTFEDIAEKNDCSVRWVYELHQRALSAFTVILKIG